MNNFFKPILLMMAFAVAMFSFSNESYANCTITDVELASSECSTTDGQINATFTVTYSTSGIGTYAVTVDVDGTSGTANGTESGTVSVTVNNIPDDSGSFDITATMNATISGSNCTANFGPKTITGTATGCTSGGGDCDDCVPNGTLTISNTSGNASEICSSNDFQAMDIICDGTVTGTRTTTFTATNSITLNAGFQSNTSGVFTATIGTITCTPPPLTDPNGEVSHRLTVSHDASMNVTVTPNPFSSSASIDYTLETEGQVLIQVFNLKGEPVATLMNGTQVAGQHTVNFEAANLPKGFYYLSLQTANERVTEQMVIMR